MRQMNNKVKKRPWKLQIILGGINTLLILINELTWRDYHKINNHLTNAHNLTEETPNMHTLQVLLVYLRIMHNKPIFTLPQRRHNNNNRGPYLRAKHKPLADKT